MSNDSSHMYVYFAKLSLEPEIRGQYKEPLIHAQFYRRDDGVKQIPWNQTQATLLIRGYGEAGQ